MLQLLTAGARNSSKEVAFWRCTCHVTRILGNPSSNAAFTFRYDIIRSIMPRTSRQFFSFILGFLCSFLPFRPPPTMSNTSDAFVCNCVFLRVVLAFYFVVTPKAEKWRNPPEKLESIMFTSFVRVSPLRWACTRFICATHLKVDRARLVFMATNKLIWSACTSWKRPSVLLLAVVSPCETENQSGNQEAMCSKACHWGASLKGLWVIQTLPSLIAAILIHDTRLHTCYPYTHLIFLLLLLLLLILLRN